MADETRIKVLRKEKGWSQAKLGRVAEVNSSQLSVLEWRKGVIGPAGRKRISAALERKESELFDANGFAI